MVAPYAPIALPKDARRDACRAKFVRVGAVIPDHGRGSADVKRRRGDGLVRALFVGDVVVRNVDAHLFRKRERRDVVDGAVVLHLRPKHLRHARSVVIRRLPRDRLIDGICRRDGNIRKNEREPMVIDQLRRAAKRLVDRRRLRPSGSRDISRHRVIVAVDFCDRRNARLVAVAVLPADDDVGVNAVRVDGRIGRLNGRHRRLADVGDRQRAGRVAVRQRVVRAERLSREDKRRDDDVVCRDRRAAVCKGQLDLFLLALHRCGVEHVDNIDRADVSDAVVKVRLDRLAERVFAPLIGRGKLRAEKRASFVDV